MPLRRNKEKFQQRTQFERRRIFGLREGGFSYRAIGLVCGGTVPQGCEFGSSRPTSTEQLEYNWQWATEGIYRGDRKVTSARDDRHFAPYGDNDRTASSGSWQHVGLQLQRCTNVGFVNSSTSIAPWIACKGAFIQDRTAANHRRLRLQWAHKHRARQANWRKLSFQMNHASLPWDHHGRIHVRRYAGERQVLHSALLNDITPGVMVWLV
ncbi:uncharacterized protein TNCV_2189981 [Trichonephila clavipes]|nr:uncharacterized protein TNCV_2189981 [Trichonephila clavipes]